MFDPISLTTGLLLGTAALAWWHKKPKSNPLPRPIAGQRYLLQGVGRIRFTFVTPPGSMIMNGWKWGDAPNTICATLVHENHKDNSYYDCVYTMEDRENTRTIGAISAILPLLSPIPELTK